MMPVGVYSSVTGLIPCSELRNHRGHSVASSGVSGRVSVRMPRAAARWVTWCSVMLGSAVPVERISVYSSQATSAPVVVSTMAPEESTMTVSSAPSSWHSAR